MTENSQNIMEYNKDDSSLRDSILHLMKWWKYLLSKWYIILAVSVCGAVLGLVYAFINKPIYTANTTFVLEVGDKGNSLSQYAGIASTLGIDLGSSAGGIFQGENILELYKSRTMISKSLLSPAEFNGKNQLLIDRYIIENKLRDKWVSSELQNIQFSSINKYENPRQQLIHDSIISFIVKDIENNYLSVGKPDKKLNIIRVSVNSKDELFAKAFNESIVKNVNSFYLQTKTKKSIENVTILQQKADSVRSVMTGSIYKAAQVLDVTPHLNPTRQVQRVAPLQTAQASAEVNKSILGQLVQNLELSKIALQKETPLIQVVDEPILPLDYEKMSKKKGILIGGIVGGIIIVFLLIIIRIMGNIMGNEQV